MILSKLAANSSKALPITLNEFCQVSRVKARTNTTTTWLTHKPIGLAISGGVDSMALATLCAEVQKSRGVQFQAFVVDHGARPDSSEEARNVSKVLLEMGIDTEILRIQWSEDIIPLKAPNFESLARKHRFQALGRACRDRGIPRLFLAHHEDDVAETVMMRLAGGHRGRGLTGIRSVARIPECYGIYGVHESFLDMPETELLRHAEPLNPSFLNNQEKLLPVAQVGIMTQHMVEDVQDEQDGVYVIRPLLPFSKERLIATCVAHGTPWFEDPTNKDQTLTMRNAIRHIFQNHALPNTLEKNALISLSSRVRRKTTAVRETAKELLRKHAQITFDPLAGTLTIQFPQCPFPLQPDPQKQPTSCILPKQCEIARAMLEMAIESITPKEHIQTSNLDRVCQAVFPALYPIANPPRQCPSSFTVNGVQFTRRQRLKRSQDASLDARMAELDDIPTEWFLARQRYPLSPSLQPSLTISTPLLTQDDRQQALWTLYDGRYWFHLTSRTNKPLIVRPLRPPDLRPFRTALDPAVARHLALLLHRYAPGAVRFSLPALVLRQPDGADRVIALPTLGIAVPRVEQLVTWRVRYRRVRGLSWVAAAAAAAAADDTPCVDGVVVN